MFYFQFLLVAFKVIFIFKKELVVFHFQNNLRLSSIFKSFEFIFHFQIFWGCLPLTNFLKSSSIFKFTNCEITQYPRLLLDYWHQLTNRQTWPDIQLLLQIKIIIYDIYIALYTLNMHDNTLYTLKHNLLMHYYSI